MSPLSRLLIRPTRETPLSIVGTALVSTALMLALRMLLHPILEERTPYATFFFSVVFSAWYAGVWAGGLALLMGTLTAFYFFVPPYYTFDTKNQGDLAGLILYISVSGLLILIAGQQRRAQLLAQEYLDKLTGEITRRENAVRQREEAIAQLDALFEGSPVGLAFLDDQLRYRRLNRSLAEINGLPLEAHLGKSVQELFPDLEVTPFLVATLQRVMSQRETVVTEASDNIPSDPDNKHHWLAAFYPVTLQDELLGVGAIIQDITERKRTEEALRESEAQLRLITDALPVLISYLDHEERYQFNNKAYEDWFNVKRETVRGKTIREITTPEGYEVLRPYIEKALAGQQVTFEREVAYRTGTRYIEANYIPDWDAQQQVRGFFVLVRDITTQKLAERRSATLHQITEAFSRALTADEIAEITLKVGLTVYKARAVMLMRLNDSSTALELLSVSNIRPELASRFGSLSLDFDAPLTRAVKKGEPVWLENQALYRQQYPGLAEISARDGTQAVAAIPFRLNEQIVGGIGISFSEDISFSDEERAFLGAVANQCAQALERARLYTQVQEARERLEVTLTSIGDGVIATDSSGQVTFMNSVAESLTGWQLVHAVGKPLDKVFDIVSEATGEKIESPFDKVMREGQVVGLANHTLLLAQDGRQIPIDDSGAPIRDEHGHIIGVVLVFRDISERKKSEILEYEQRLLAESLRDTAMALNSTLELGEVLDRILVNIEGVIPHEAANILLVDRDKVRLVRSKGYASTPDQAVLMMADMPILQAVSSIRHPILVSNATEAHAQFRMLNIPQMQSYAIVPLLIRNEVVGFIHLGSHIPGFFTAKHADRLEAFGAQAAIAIQNAKLYLQAHELAVIEERQRLARDLHDAVSQTLFSSSVIAESLPRLKNMSAERFELQLTQLHRLNRGAFAEMRNLLFELRPASLVEARIQDLLQHLADAAMARKMFQVKVTISEAIVLPESVKITFYRIAQEALNNIVKHSRASEVTVDLQKNETAFVLTLKDNGRGFDPTNLSMNKGMGLSIMQERAESIGAVCTLISQPDQGTEIVVTWQP